MSQSLAGVRGLRIQDAAAFSYFPLSSVCPSCGCSLTFLDRPLSLVTAHAPLSADTLTGVLIVAYCHLLGIMMFPSDHFLHSFSPLHHEANQ